MTAKPEENLDSVIADLIDDDGEESSSPGMGLPDIEFSGPPVQLTERAARQVQKIRSAENLESELRLRVAVEGGGCSGLSYKLGFDYKTDDDEVLVNHGIEILVDSKHMMYLRGISVDYPDGLDARGFTFDNPNATETCGCGSSFAT